MARISISKAMKGLVGGAGSSSTDDKRTWKVALILRSMGLGTHPSEEERIAAVRLA